jgi:mannitol-1-phosphate/altronate dehydrogenase
VRDPELVEAMQQFWDLAAPLLPDAAELDLDAYRRETQERFANPRMGYPLIQIAGDGLDKLRNRVAPVIRAALAAGEPAEPALRIVEAWAQWLCEDPTRAATDQNGELLCSVLGAGDDRMRGLMKLVIEGDR